MANRMRRTLAAARIGSGSGAGAVQAAGVTVVRAAPAGTAQFLQDFQQVVLVFQLRVDVSAPTGAGDDQREDVVVVGIVGDGVVQPQAAVQVGHRARLERVVPQGGVAGPLVFLERPAEGVGVCAVDVVGGRGLRTVAFLILGDAGGGSDDVEQDGRRESGSSPVTGGVRVSVTAISPSGGAVRRRAGAWLGERSRCRGWARCRCFMRCNSPGCAAVLTECTCSGDAAFRYKAAAEARLGRK